MSDEFEIEAQFMQSVARALDDVLNAGAKGKDREVGFALLVFPFGDASGKVNYVGSGDREQMLEAFRNLVARWEGHRPNDVGHA